MSLVRVQCVAVHEKIQPLFKRLFEFAVDNCVTIGGIYTDVATEIRHNNNNPFSVIAADAEQQCNGRDG